ncbi:unnamed protein product [Rotaria sordida]|uniref:Uncharacterized protein n=1 Tax=Rotaria sordida TaxID=392033 RepID=A0A819X8C8_9BILA|nr:unnamed protein product [Rotaria sordida]
MIPTEKLTELDVKGIKRTKELSHIVYSDEREESPLKIPKVTPLSSSTLASLRGTPTDGKLKPNYYSKKSKYKDDSNVQSPTGSTRTPLSQGHLKTSRITSSVLSEAVLKCDKCRQPIECIGYCIIVCGTLVHHEPAITAPLLMDIIETIGRVAASHRYAWQENSTVVALANSTSTAQQFIHCAFQQ